MRRYVQHQEGDYYDADTLLKLQRRLIDADYFGFVAVTPRLARRRVSRVEAAQPAMATADGVAAAAAQDGGVEAPDGEEAPEEPVVPIVVQVAPAPRTVYTAGVSIGTDSGLGVRGGVRRRWVNQRGHKANAEFELSQRLTAAAVNYEIFATDGHL